MIEKIRFIKNPLTIIAIFAGLAEIAGTSALALVDKDLQSIFLWFVMGFPFLLVCLFFLTLNFNPTVLYAPSDFQDEQNFLHILLSRRKLAESVEMITEQLETNYPNISERLLGEVQAAGENDGRYPVKDPKHFIQEIKDHLISFQKSADEVVSEAGRQVFPQSKLQADILDLLSSSKHEMTFSQIASALQMSDEAVSRALDRLWNRNLIFCKNDGQKKLYSFKL
ncbi:MAG: winged helix-turn-helix domain-containing protein [Methanosarcinaceae archaeon]|nr:winged helix-turn-helix domain-containing protein [Methanosarcinaceae archaeon]